MQVHQTPTLLLTRPRALSEQFAEGLRGAHIVIAPLMEIEATGSPVGVDGIMGLILTSQNAVPFAPACTLPVYCVGSRTAQVARDEGFDVRIVAQDAEDLVEQLMVDRPRSPLLHLHGVHVRGDIAARLTGAGIETHGVAVYDQTVRAPDDHFHDALEQRSLIVPLFSPRSAELFAQAAPRLSNGTLIIAFSSAVADALPPDWTAQALVLKAPNASELGKAMEPFGIRRD